MVSHHKRTGYWQSSGSVVWRYEEQGWFHAAVRVLWSRFERAAPVLLNIRKESSKFLETCIGDGMTVSQYRTITRSVGRVVALAVLFISLLTCTASGYDIDASMLPMEINETVVSLYGNEFTLTEDWNGSATDHFAVMIVAPDVIFDGGGHLLDVTLADDSIEEYWQNAVQVIAHNVTVRNVRANTWDHGITVDNSADCRIESGNLTGQMKSGIGIHLCSGVVIQNTVIDSPLQNGVWVGESSSIQIHDSWIHDAGTGISFQNVTNSDISGNTITDDETGMVIVDTDGITIRNNSISNLRYSGVWLNASNAITLSENRVSGSSEGDGISVSGSTHITCEQNEATGNANDGITFDNVFEGTIFQSNASGNTNNGIRIFNGCGNISVGRSTAANNANGAGIRAEFGSNILTEENDASGNTNGGGIVYLFIDGGYIINNTAGGNEGGIGVVESGQIAIHGNRANGNVNGDGIRVGNSTHISCDLNEATGNFNSGIVYVNVTEGAIWRSNVSGNNDNGIGIWEGCGNISAGANLATDNIQGNAISVDNGSNIDIVDNDASRSTNGIGISYSNVTGGNVVNNTASNNRYNGIGLSGCHEVYVNVNRANQNTEGDGIHVSNATGVGSDLNEATGNFYNGIVFDNVIEGNIFRSNVNGNNENGIGIWNGCSNISIGENTATNNLNGSGINVDIGSNINSGENNVSDNVNEEGIIYNAVNAGYIVNNTANHNRGGIALFACNQIFINENRANGNTNGDGIRIANSSTIGSDLNEAAGNFYNGIVFDNVIEGNIFRSNVNGNNDNGIGIWNGCSNISIGENTATNNLNGSGINVDTGSNINCGENNVSDNVNEGGIIYNAVNGGYIVNNTANHNRGGIWISACRQLFINENRANGNTNGDGIRIANSSTIGSDLNEATGNFYNGIVFDNVIEGNIFRSNVNGNNDNGIGIWNGCSNISIGGNTATNNLNGSGINVDIGSNINSGENNVSNNVNGGGIIYNAVEAGYIVNNSANNNRWGIGLRACKRVSINENHANENTESNGIRVENSSEIGTDLNQATGNFRNGIAFDKVVEGNIFRNNASGNNEHGIGIWNECRNITVGANTATNTVNGTAISVSNGSNINIVDNNVSSNAHGGGINYNFVEKGNIINNSANDNRGGIGLFACNQVALIDNEASRNSEGNGITAGNSTDIWLSSNILDSNAPFGIWFFNTLGGAIQGNVVTNNSIAGIGIAEGSRWILAEGNTVTENTVGIHLGEADDNLLFNNFLQNSVNTEISPYNSNNTWSVERQPGPNIIGGPEIGGNFWATPMGDGFSQVTPDIDGDGFCDSVFELMPGHVDELPLAGNEILIYPNHVTKGDRVSIQVFGKEEPFAGDMTIHLVNATLGTITSLQTVVSSPTMVTGIFNLTIAPVGTYDLSLEWPDHHVRTITSGIIISESPLGSLAAFPEIFILPGVPQTFEVEVPETGDLFVTLQKLPFTGDQHYSFESGLSLETGGVVVASTEGNQDQILHLVDPAPGTYNVTLDALQSGRGRLIIWTALPQLPLGSWVVSPIYRPFGSTFHQVMIPSGVQNITFRGESMGEWSYYHVYYRQVGADRQWLSSFAPEPVLTIENPESGLYILEFVDTQMISTEDQSREVLLRVESGGIIEPPIVYFPEITDYAPRRGGNTGGVTLAIQGGWLDPNATVSLHSETLGTITSDSVVGSDDQRSLSASLDLSGKKPGSYTLILQNPESPPITGPSPFIIEEGGRSDLWTGIVGREKIRVGRPATYLLNYGNNGTLDMPAPLIALSTDPPSQYTFARFNSSGEWKQMDGELVIIAAGPADAPDILPAGSSFSVSVEVRTDESGEFTLTATPYGGDPIFTAPQSSSVIDAYCTAPGIPLVFGRSYPGEPSSYQGPFGYGWTHSFDLRLQQFEDGHIGIGGGDQYDLVLYPEEDGTYAGERGYPTLVMNGDGSATLTALEGSITRFRTDGLPGSTEDLNGNTVSFVYDSSSRLIRIQHSSGDRFTLEYAPSGRISHLVDHEGRDTVYTYDPTGTLLLSVTRHDGNTTHYTYQEQEGGYALAGETYPGGISQEYQYGGDGRLRESSVNTGEETGIIAYDEEKRVTTITDEAGSRSIVRVNEFGQVVEQQNSLGASITYQYNKDGDPVLITGAKGEEYAFETDERGNVVRTINPLSQDVAMGYDTRFNALAWVRDPRGNTLNFTYDTAGNLKETRYPDNSHEQFVYDDAGNIISMTDRNGEEIQYSYNSRGQLTRKDYPDGTSVAFSYDADGNLISAANEEGPITMEYNTRNQLTRITYPGGLSQAYTYDEAGRLVQRTEQDGFTIRYSYDKASRLARVADGSDATIVRYAYDPSGRLSRKELGSGAFTTYSYDTAGQVTEQVNYNKDGTVLSRFTYTYDLSGNPVTIETLDGICHYDYDAIGQLTHVTSPDGNSTSYQYDAAGNRISVTDKGITTAYTTNVLNQYTQAGSTTFTYDKNGNMVSKTEQGNTTTYEYNFENRLTRITSPDGIWEYEYDALGNCKGVTVNGNQVWYGINPLGMGDITAEYDGEGHLVTRYLHGAGLVALQEGGGSRYYYHFSPLGHTTEITTSSGNVVNRYQYTPFGEYRTKVEGIANTFTYVGEYGVKDEGNRLLYMRMRMYSPTIGRFIAEEPVRIQISNLYGYCDNNPIIQFDPKGLLSISLKYANRDIAAYFEYGNYGGKYRNNGKSNVPQYTGSFDAQPKDRADEAFRIHDYLVMQGDANAALKAKAYLLGELGLGYLTGHPPTMGEIVATTGFFSIPNEVLDADADHFKQNPQSGSSKSGSGATSDDPEDKFGPTGYDHPGAPSNDLDRYITGAQPLSYRVDFWNAETATANVCDVDAYDQMDTDLNWSSFRFTEVGFTDWRVPLTPCQYFNVFVDTRPAMDYIVKIEGNYNPSTGIANLTYHTLNATTLQTPEDPLEGFLPAISVSGKEVGWFAYTISPKPGLSTGTVIEDQAFVNFDYTEHLPAPKDAPWKNTIDAGAPSSSVSVSLVNGTGMLCTFSGSDDAGGSGIRDYTLYVSDNGGPSQPMLNRVKTSSSTLQGVSGHTYTFYSVASDNVGNTEGAPTSPDSTLTVPYPTSLTLISPNGGGQYPQGSNETILWNFAGTPGSMVMIELLKGGSVHTVLTSGTAVGSGGIGSFVWNISHNLTVGSDYTVRITSTSNPAYYDTSDAPFSIGGGSPITVMSPNGGEQWKQGSTQTLTWQYTGEPGPLVKIEALRGTKVLATVAPSYPIGSGGAGSYPLTFPYGTPLGSDYFIRITSTSNVNYTDTSDAPFRVIPPITVIAPNGGEEWQQGSTQTIQWNYTGNPGPTVKIEALRGDTVLATITPGTSAGSGGSGSMNLTLPMNTPLGTDFRIRISSTSNAIYTDTSDASFKIVANTGSSISVVSPSGGENYVQGSTQTIQWDYTGDPGPTVKIEALRGETVLATVASSYPIGSSGSGSYDLKFPYSTPVGSDFRIKVTSTSNPAWSDTSGTFTISPAITVLSPDGGEEWNQGSMHPITWTYSGNPGTAVKIEALRNDKVLAVITPSTPIASGSYSLTFPANTPLGNDYRIRITSTSYPACTDTSNGMFAIIAI
ncbi:MAG: RHS Repeat protein [Euryarchaeota archaeon ADurb.BinA087]|nr:MAG: RHS Repeat protein [Euryarchaeota archaeon ADurb.BinA087]